MSDIEIKVFREVASIKANSRKARRWLNSTRTSEFNRNPVISRDYVDEFEKEAVEAGLDVKVL
jgi:hypothetical protein